MNDHDFRKLLDVYGYSWEGYRRVRKGVKKRIVRRMQEVGCRDVDAYLAMLAKGKPEKHFCDLLLCVSISRFFRDRQLWQILEREILPDFIEKAEFRIWSAGCACGEEVYSLSIVRDRFRSVRQSVQEIRITATDKHPEYLSRARQAEYTRSSLRKLPETWRDRYFDKVPGKKSFSVKPFLKADIHWRLQPFEFLTTKGGFDMVLLRNNLLTYYTGGQKEELFKGIVSCLRPGGYLAIGRKEGLPTRFSDRFHAHPSCPFLFNMKYGAS